MFLFVVDYQSSCKLNKSHGTKEARNSIAADDRDPRGVGGGDD